MSAERKKIVSMLHTLHFPEGKMSEEYTFTLEAVDMFYYKRNIGAADIKLGFVDGANDGGIDYIYSDGETLYLIQGKSSAGLSVEDVDNALNKMAKTFTKFTDRKYEELNDAVKSALSNAYDNLTEDKNVELVLFTNTVFNKDAKKKIDDFSSQDLLSKLKLTSYSNFLKSDQYYDDIILQSFDNLDDYDLAKIGQFMEVFTKK